MRFQLAAVRTPIFEIGGFRALLTLAVAGVLTTALYSVVINFLSIRAVESTLGMGTPERRCGEVREGDLLDLDTVAGGARLIEELRDRLDSAAAQDDQRTPAQRLWTRLCANLHRLSDRDPAQGNPLQVAVSGKEQGPQEGELLLPQHRESGTVGVACPDRTDRQRFAWLPVTCLHQRVLGVRSEERFLAALLGIQRPVPQEAVQGTVYLYQRSRLPTRAAGAWERQQLFVLRDFDKMVTGAIEELQEAAGLPRWLLRNLNGPFQWVILTCGLWGVLLLAQLWLQAYWQQRAVVRGKGLYRQFEKDCSSRAVGEVTEQYFRWLSHSSSILVDWILEIVPLLGFIGTVVGMIAAMASVARVVASDPGPELVSAMARVSDSLSLAFSTTFVALALSILLYLIRPAVYRAQEMVVDTLPRVLDNHREPAGDEAG